MIDRSIDRSLRVLFYESERAPGTPTVPYAGVSTAKLLRCYSTTVHSPGAVLEQMRLPDYI